MNRTARRPRAARFPLTIDTLYGSIKLELELCEHCGEHFNFRVLEVAPALCTHAAEPFLYRLMNTLDAIGSDLWLSLPPKAPRGEIGANISRALRLASLTA